MKTHPRMIANDDLLPVLKDEASMDGTASPDGPAAGALPVRVPSP
jgi:hypothetical protein